MISVIIPAYQHGSIIKKCLDSIFSQTYQDFEVIVVNDGSTDNTAEVLSQYPKNIIVINQENKGANIARNSGFAKSKGAYVIFCDADVVMKNIMLEKMLAALDENPYKAYAYSSFQWGLKTFRSFPFDAERLKKMNYIHTTSLIRRESFLGFDENIKKFQDWDLWLTLLSKNLIGAYIPEILYKIQPRKNGISGWLPSFIYKISLARFGVKLKRLEEYKEAEAVIKKKHSLF